MLFEEIENGLHPLAVCRLVEYLIAAAGRKNLQILFTTHSDYSLMPLPSEAIWASIDGKVEQGKLSIPVLRAVSGRIDRRLAIFVEDDFAEKWIRSVIRERFGDAGAEIGVYALQGDGNAVRIHRAHLQNPSVTFQSICFIDGDSKQEGSHDDLIFRLPGTAPETTVFNQVLENLNNNLALLTVACQRPVDKQKEVAGIVEEISRTNRDPHLLFNQVGVRLGFVSEPIVAGAFLAVWISEHRDQVDAIATAIETGLKSQKAKTAANPVEI